MTKKKVLVRITVTVLILLVVCTMLSRSIYLAMLPQVSTSKVSMGNISTTLNYDGAFDYSKKQTVIAKEAWQFTEVNVKAGDPVEKGDVLAKINMADADLTARQLEMNIKGLETQLKNTYGKDAKAAVQLSLDVERRKQEQFFATYPKNGVIKAKTDGRVLACNYQTGDVAVPETLVMDLQTSDSQPIVQWTTSLEEGESMNVDSSVALNFIALKKGSKELFTLKSEITSKVQDVENNCWNFEVQMGMFDNQIPLESKPRITYSEATANGQTIVPVSALTYMGGDQAILYVVSTRQGVFGEENIVKQVEVKVLADNNINAAIEGTLEQNDKIVTYASKSLHDGAVVAVE